MSIWRKLALGILSPLFIFLLCATAFDIGFTRVATHPATVKKVAADSGIYNSIVPNLLKQSGDITTPLGDISASDPAVLQAASQLASPQDVQRQTEAAIDSVYLWLDGNIAQPQFTIGLAGDNNSFANNVSEAIEQRLAGLPACSTAQDLSIVRGGNFDAVNATCLPRGVTAASVAAQVKSSLEGNQDFFNQASFNSNGIKGSNGQPVFAQPSVKNIPKQYQRAKKVPFILSVLTILTGVGIIFISSTWQKGLRHIGLNLLIIGLIMLVFSWTVNRTVNNNLIPKIKADNIILQQNLRSLVGDIAQQVDRNYWLFGGIYTVLGFGAVGAAEFYIRRDKTAAPVPAKADSSKNSKV